MLVKDEHSNTRTCLSLDNSGNIRFDTDIEMTQGVFNTSKSVLWTKFSRVFATEIRDRYIELRKDKFTIDNFMKYYYEDQISKIPEMDYNKNFYNKYLATKDRQAYLFMMHGRQYEYMYKWIDERLYFLDTYWSYGSEFSSQCTVRVEYADYATVPVTFNIQTYVPSYVDIIFKNSGSDGGTNDMTVRQKVPRGKTVQFSKFISTSTDQEIIIYNASNLKTIGDVSVYTPKTVLIGAAKKLVELTVGTDLHPNPNLQDLSLLNNTYLTSITANNCSALKSLSLKDCSNLEYFYSKGSALTNVEFPEGAPLKEITLPATITNINLKNLAILDNLEIERSSVEGTKISRIYIENCPKLTGYKDADGNITEGKFVSEFLNYYTPTSPLTRIDMEVYGYISNSDFLNYCATLANQYPSNFNLRGQIRYIGRTIPSMYSYYETDFPKLKVTYDNVNDVSGMFEKYKNINLVWNRVERHGTDDNITIETVYYWTDLREGEFPDDAYVTYEGRKGRLLEYYDDQDMKLLADEIKKLLKPFSKFTNMNSMFSGMTCLEYLHDDTFDGIDISEAHNERMFNNCYTLKYFEIPNNTQVIEPYMFANCYRVLAYIPASVSKIDRDAFYINTIESTDLGTHPVLLFESSMDWSNVEGIRDARFGIIRNPESNHAIRTEKQTIGDTEVNIKYFLKDTKKIIKEIYKDDNSAITEQLFNILNENDTASKFDNPLEISELLGGALVNFTNLKSIAIPSFSIPVENTDSVTKLKELEVSIAKLFTNYKVTNDNRKTIAFESLYIIPSDDKRKIVSRYFAKDTKIQKIFISPEILEIERSAFENTVATTIEVPVILTSKLKTIGYAAFKNSGITSITIPDTVTNIGEEAFMNCQSFNSLRYSNSMTYVPESCFRNVLTAESSPRVETISGFSANITEIKDHAFNNAKNLVLFKETPDDLRTTTFDCYFICDETKTKNINYFKNLTYIGKYAFNNVYNIKRFDISDTITYIGASAFIPPVESVVPDTLISWTGTDYSNMTIEASAFLNRQFNWLCSTPGMKNQIMNKICYIPNVGQIGQNAFSPYFGSDAEETHLAYLDYMLVASSKEYVNANWKNFVTNHLETIYNFSDAVIQSDINAEGTSRSTFMYFLQDLGSSRNALIARLMKTNNIDSQTAFIQKEIEYNSNKYNITEILPRALTYNDSNLNNIYFEHSSELKRIGSEAFTNTNIFSISVLDELSSPTEKCIPASMVKSENYPLPIGEGIPFKNTSWFKSNTNVKDDFVYLNEYCIGYIYGDTTVITKAIENNTKFIYEDAFAYDSALKNITLPSSLVRIMNRAFRNTGLYAIDFTPCQETLEYIGNNAFDNCLSLTEMNYTKNINHIGKYAVNNCVSLEKITFADDMVLDSTSEPIKPYVNDKNKNIVTRTFIISTSMGDFFAPSSYGFEEFYKLSRIDNLTLSTAINIINLPEITSDGDYKDLYQSDWGETKYYVVDFGRDELVKEYPEARYSNAPLRLVTSKNTFICPKGDYKSNIDISGIDSTFDDADIARILLGTSKTSSKKFILRSAVANRMSAAIFANIRNVRPITFEIKDPKDNI